MLEPRILLPAGREMAVGPSSPCELPSVEQGNALQSKCDVSSHLDSAVLWNHVLRIVGVRLGHGTISLRATREELQQCLETDSSHRKCEIRYFAELTVEELAGLQWSISGSFLVTPADRLQFSECGVKHRRGWNLFTQPRMCDAVDVTAKWRGVWEPLEHAKRDDLLFRKMTKLNEAEQVRATGSSIGDACVEHGIQVDERDSSNKTFGTGGDGCSAFCSGSGAVKQAPHWVMEDGIHRNGQLPPDKTTRGGGDAFDTFSSQVHAWQSQRMPSFLRIIQLGLDGQRFDHMIAIANLLVLWVHRQRAFGKLAMTAIPGIFLQVRLTHSR